MPSPPLHVASQSAADAKAKDFEVAYRNLQNEHDSALAEIKRLNAELMALRGGAKPSRKWFGR